MFFDIIIDRDIILLLHKTHARAHIMHIHAHVTHA